MINRLRWGMVVWTAALLLALTGCQRGESAVVAPTAGAAAATAPPPSPQATATAAPQLSYDAFIDALGQLDRLLRAEEAATYAGYCVAQPGRRDATLAFTTGAAETARAYLDGHPLAAYVRERTAEYSAALLDANKGPEIERLYDLGFDVRGGVDDCRNRIVITVLSPDEVETALAAAGVQLPEYVELVAGSMVTPEA